MPIDKTDAYGDSMIDAIYRGSTWYASMTCMEYKAGSTGALWPFSSTLGRFGVIGRLMFDLSAALVLTAVTGTPAASSPATVTASKAIIAPGFQSRLLFGPNLRTVPLRFILFPYTSGGNIQPFILA